MNNTHTTADRRVRKTKKQLFIALTSLLKTKNLENISVKELTDLADVNRSTFYIHYKDIFDMVEKIEQQIIEGFNKVMDTRAVEAIKSNNLVPILTGLYGYLGEYCELFIAVMGKPGDVASINKLIDSVKKKFLNEWLNIVFGKKNDAYENYCKNFIVMGFLGLLQTWLMRGMQETPAQMAQMTDLMIQDTVSKVKAGYPKFQ